MKVYISADIEGIATTVKWPETWPSDREYPYHAEEMTQEVLACCRAAIDAGATEIVIKDAHGPGTNIDIKQLPACCRVIKGWSGHPYEMVQDIDDSFDACLFIGYHSEAGGIGNPMSHTMTTRTQHVRINGMPASEFTIYSLCAAYEGVPTVFLSGDAALCASAEDFYPWLITAPVKSGEGSSVCSLAPEAAWSLIYDKTREALTEGLAEAKLPVFPEWYEVEVEYKEHTDACNMQYFPGCRRIDSHTIGFETNDFYTMVQTLKFVL